MWNKIKINQHSLLNFVCGEERNWAFFPADRGVSARTIIMIRDIVVVGAWGWVVPPLVAFARAAILIRTVAGGNQCAVAGCQAQFAFDIRHGTPAVVVIWASWSGRACRPPTRAPCLRRRRTTSTTTSNCRPCRRCSCTPSAWWPIAASSAVGKLHRNFTSRCL